MDAEIDSNFIEKLNYLFGNGNNKVKVEIEGMVKLKQLKNSGYLGLRTGVIGHKAIIFASKAFKKI